MAQLLWQPSPERVLNTNMLRFIRFVNRRQDRKFETFEELYQWSIGNIPEFWRDFWDFADIMASRQPRQVIDDLDKMPGARWFSGARLNFAQNLLRHRDDHIALIFKGESRPPISMTYAQLYAQVAQMAKALRDAGVVAGDRVVAFMPNIPATVVAMLAATSIGATWSSCSPDFGIRGVLDRFGQISPKILFTADGYRFKGRTIDSLARLEGILDQLPSVQTVVVAPHLHSQPQTDRIPRAVAWADFTAPATADDIQFEHLPFDHPLYIMYSSGTTGLPKCMVQGAGGILINHLKELLLHVDLKRTDTIFYFTTCGWMMWNYLISSLAVGASVVLYDGNPFYPDPGALWQLAEEVGISIFGTSAGYIDALQTSGFEPIRHVKLDPLRTVLSTGSPLSAKNFDWVYRAVKSDLQLASISGGSDINGCFALGNPMGPVYAGELQCRALAMPVEAYNDQGKPVRGEKGELVCLAPFPSMPIYFWNDPGNSKYEAAYFQLFPGVWSHGDFIEITARGGVIIHGRSDATLNPGGVRIGTAEIYRQIESLPEIEDGVAVGQNWNHDVRIILFVRLAAGIEMGPALEDKIKRTIRENASPRHVPAKIIAVADIPYTHNLKKVEVAVRKMIHNQPVHNQDALKNPECLRYFTNLKELNDP